MEHLHLARDIHVRTLENGLVVAVEENHTTPVVTLRVYVKTGSLYEQEYLGSGISHYFEHLAAGGSTATRSERQSRAILRSIGGASNAYTSKSHTCYYITTTDHEFDEALSLLSDWIMHCALAPSEVDREKGVILQEIQMGRDDPGRALYNMFYETMFQEHETRYPVIGYRENFERITRADLRKYHRRHYIPNNMVFVVVGDVRADEVHEKAACAFRDFQRRPHFIPPLHTEPRQTSRRFAEKSMDVRMAYLYMGFHTVDLGHPDLYALDMLSTLLSHGDSSILHRRMVEDKQLAYAVSTWSHTPAQGAGVFAVTGLLDYRHCEAFEQEVLGVLQELADKGVEQGIMDKAKRQKLADEVFSKQRVEDLGGDLGWNLTDLGDPFFSEKYIRRMQEITASDVMEAIPSYFSPEGLTVAIVKPHGAGAPVHRRHGAGGENRRGAVHKETLGNGMTLLTREMPELPLVSIQVYLLGGVRFEDDGTSGIGNFMMEMLPKGTRTRTALQIAHGAESMGSQIKSSAGRNSFGIGMTILKDDMETGLTLLSDVLCNPAFSKDELEKHRNLILAAIRQQEDQWQAQATRLLRASFFKKHPYRLDLLGREDVMKRLLQEDLLAHHQRTVTPGNAVMAVFGAVETRDVIRGVEAYFAMRDTAPYRPAIPPESERTRMEYVFKQNRKNQMVITVAYPSVSLADSDRAAMHVLDAVLSGIGYPGGCLHHALREKRDLVYFVHGVNWMGMECGVYYVMTQTSPDRYDEVVRIIQEQFTRICDEKVHADELDKAKRICMTMEKISGQTAGELAADAALNELLGLGYDFHDAYLDRIPQVTAEDVQRTARKYFRHPLLAVTGPERPRTFPT